MSDNTTSLKVIVVSPDVKLLHEISWMLAAVGYIVECTQECDHDAVWRCYGDFDLILFDSRAAEAPDDSIFGYDANKPVYRIFMYDPAKEPDFTAWYGIGANDGLRVPISRGELLMRIRTGARYLEHERRLKLWSTQEEALGCYTKRGFLRRLARLHASEEANDGQHTLIVAVIDWFEGIRCKGGQNATDRLVASATRTIKRHAHESAITAYLGNGRFAILLLGQSMAHAKQIAEAIGEDFAGHDSQREMLARPTLTLALVPWQAGDSPSQFLETGCETLMLAQQSGGNCVLEYGEVDPEHSRWQDEMLTGNPFATVAAQDIMEPFPTTLLCDSQENAIVEALRRVSVPVCPIVDNSGRLVGVASVAERDADECDESATLSSALPISQPETIAHTASFAEIYEAFSSRGCSALVVVAEERPLGYVEIGSFLSLIEPIDRNTYSEVNHSLEDSRFLVVGSLSDGYEPQ